MTYFHICLIMKTSQRFEMGTITVAENLLMNAQDKISQSISFQEHMESRACDTIDETITDEKVCLILFSCLE